LDSLDSRTILPCCQEVGLELTTPAVTTEKTLWLFPVSGKSTLHFNVVTGDEDINGKCNEELHMTCNIYVT
jgi:hypothetical protein